VSRAPRTRPDFEQSRPSPDHFFAGVASMSSACV
jgi:hypothetical protein